MFQITRKIKWSGLTTRNMIVLIKLLVNMSLGSVSCIIPNTVVLKMSVVVISPWWTYPEQQLYSWRKTRLSRTYKWRQNTIAHLDDRCLAAEGSVWLEYKRRRRPELTSAQLPSGCSRVTVWFDMSIYWCTKSTGPETWWSELSKNRFWKWRGYVRN